MNSRSRFSTLLIAFIACLSTMACTTIKPVYNAPDASIASQLKPGDRVRITLINDRVKEIRITEVDETHIAGVIYKDSPVQKKGSIVDEEWADVFSVETVKVSPAKTAGAAVGAAAVVSIVAVGLFMGGMGVAAGGL